MPDPTVDGIKHNPLKAVIVANRPVAFGGVRERRHNHSGQMQITLDHCGMRRFWQVQTALDLGSPWWFRWFQSQVLALHGMAYDGMHMSADASDMTAWQ